MMTALALIVLFILGCVAVSLADKEQHAAHAREARALNDRLKAEIDKLDIPWAAAGDADRDAVLAKIRAGDLSAELSDWRVKVKARCPDEDKQLVPGLHSILDYRNMRRRDWRYAAEAMVIQEKEKILAPIREREERERQLAEAAERQAYARKLREDEERRKRETEATERTRRALEQKLTRPQPLSANAGANGITFGFKVENGADLVVPLRRLQHMLIVGATGAGKSVFVHQLVYQLVHRSPDVEQVIIIDLKGGVEFYRYRDNPRTRLVWEFNDVAAVMADITRLMVEREAHMRENGQQNWSGKRVFVIIDEYAEIQSELDSASTKDEKALARNVASNLVRLGRRARALGIVLVCALQKATTDAMDSALRTNLNCRVCLRVNSRQFAASVLDDLYDLPADPTTLKPGHFIYYDASRNEYHHAVTQVAPGVSFDEAA